MVWALQPPVQSGPEVHSHPWPKGCKCEHLHEGWSPCARSISTIEYNVCSIYIYTYTYTYTHSYNIADMGLIWVSHTHIYIYIMYICTYMACYRSCVSICCALAVINKLYDPAPKELVPVTENMSRRKQGSGDLKLSMPSLCPVSLTWSVIVSSSLVRSYYGDPTGQLM